MALKAFELIVDGDVQGVGYRRVVAKIARRLGVSGQVRNLDDGTVKIFVQGYERSLEEFVRLIRIDEPPIKVEKVEERERKSDPKLRTFTIHPGTIIEELQEGLGAGEEQLSLFRREFGDYRSEFKDYRSEFRSFASRTDENFKILGDK